MTVGRIFSKPQQMHFERMTTSLIEIDGRHTISRINANQLEGTDVSNDIKFIRDTSWTSEELLTSNREYLLRMSQSSKTGFLIIDDTVIEKSGRPKKMEGLGWHYSHSKSDVVYGYCLVTSHYRRGDLSIPYDFRSYVTEKTAHQMESEFKTKQELAVELIGSFSNTSGVKNYLLLDTWFTSKKVIIAGKTSGFEIIGALKRNRTFQLRERGLVHSLQVYEKNLRNSSFEEMILKGEAFKVRRITAYLAGIGWVVILISKRKKDRSKKYILSTDMTLSNEHILQYYSYRWDVEVGYLYCKDRLGLGQYQMRKLKAIEKYCALVFSAFGILEALRLSNNEKSIGQSRQYFKILKKRKYVDQVILLARKGVSKKEIYSILKIAA
jgi:hypothetical protein